MRVTLPAALSRGARSPGALLSGALVLASLLASLLAGCDPSVLRDRVTGSTPHERYARSLEAAGLGETALGRDWLMASSRSLAMPTLVVLPFREAGYFGPGEAGAIAYRVRPARGQRLRVTVQVSTSGTPGVPMDAPTDAPVEATADGPAAVDPLVPPARLFVDLFELPEEGGGAPRHIADGDSALVVLETTAGRGVSYVVRLQPELLRELRYVITVDVAPSLAFPVEGRDSRAVQSFWGAARDGGARDHQGIDIFARRGTPAIAAASGVIRDAGVTNLGGKVVWLSDTAAGQSLYYAHLDSQLVRPGDHVRVGDTLGLVGDTGNARTTAPHLHFGIYRRGEGAVDPFPFVAMPRGRAAALTADTAWLGRDARTARADVTLRVAPSAGATAGPIVPRSTMLVVQGASGSWLRVRLPDATSGYLPASAVESAADPLRGERLAASAPIRALPATTALVIDSAGSVPTSVPVVGRYRDWLLVDAPGGRRGWVESSSGHR